MPALLLWTGMLGVNGVLGLAAHLADTSSPWVDLTAQIVVGGMALSALCWDRARLFPLLQRSGLDDTTWWMPFAALGGLALFMWAYLGILSALGISSLSLLDDYREHGWPLWAAFVQLCVLPAVFEELAFRGFILERLLGVLRRKDAVIVQAAMFSVLHMLPLIFVSHWAIGLVLGLLRLRTRSLWPGITVHAAWNALVLVQEVAAA